MCMAETAFYSETLKDKYYLSGIFNNHHDTPPNFLCELKSQTVLCGHIISTAILLLIINIIIIIVIKNTATDRDLVLVRRRQHNAGEG